MATEKLQCDEIDTPSPTDDEESWSDAPEIKEQPTTLLQNALAITCNVAGERAVREVPVSEAAVAEKVVIPKDPFWEETDRATHQFGTQFPGTVVPNSSRLEQFVRRVSVAFTTRALTFYPSDEAAARF